jgi:hypothetical protein
MLLTLYLKEWGLLYRCQYVFAGNGESYVCRLNVEGVIVRGWQFEAVP